MRLYPRALHKGKARILVNNEQEEYEAGLQGYERHRNPEVNAREKGTDKEVLRVNPEEAKKQVKEEKEKQYRADVIEEAKKAIEEDKEKAPVKKRRAKRVKVKQTEDTDEPNS